MSGTLARFGQQRARLLPTAAVLGAASVFGFAPFYWFPLPVITLAALIALWQHAPRRRDAALAGFCFGLGYFLTGVSWVYVSLHDFGGMPALLAAALTFVLCAYLALYPALIGLLYHTFGRTSLFATLAALPALWALAEWLRGWLFTGFPWLELGDAQIPGSPLAGVVPVFGIHAATWLTVVSAALLALLIQKPRLRVGCGVAVCALWLGGYGLKQISWTQPVGAPLTVSLLQGNIPQSMKWDATNARHTLDSYRELALSSKAQLIVLPETALPMFLHQVPSDYLDLLAAHARSNHGDLLIGVPEIENPRSAEPGNDDVYYNSVVSLGRAPPQVYRKSHLVPFGEFIPLKPLFGWFLDWAQIPLADFGRGAITQQPLAVAGQQVAINICYEDVFGAEIIRQLPQATLLANVSNVAWFGRSLAPAQHLQISQARALETGRFMLRATNTGMTAIVGPHGEVRAVAPAFTTTVVTGEVQGYAGATPYVRWGDAPLLAGALAVLLIAGWLAVRKAGKI